MGDDVVIAAGVGVRVKDLIATALLATLVLVHAVHKSIRVFATANELFVIATWRQLAHALIARIESTVMGMMSLTPAVLGVAGSGGQLSSKCLVTLADVALA